MQQSQKFLSKLVLYCNNKFKVQSYSKGFPSKISRNKGGAEYTSLKYLTSAIMQETSENKEKMY